jgi:hypothetical protein
LFQELQASGGTLVWCSWGDRKIRGRCPLAFGFLFLLSVALFAGCGGGGNSSVPKGGGYKAIKPTPLVRGVAVDPAAGIVSGADASSVIRLLGHDRYQLVVTNTSSIGFINTFTWTPPDRTKILAVTRTQGGDCWLAQGAISCRLALHPPSCTCRGDGGRVTISFTAKTPVAKDGYTHGIGMQYSSFMITSETPVPYMIPSSPLEKPSANADLPLCKRGQPSTAANPCLQHG